MPIIYVDADACPVKDEIYRVADRLNIKVIVVANSIMRVPSGEKVELVVKTGFGVVDDWIAEMCGANDIVITADIPLAARSLARGSRVLDPRGRPFTTQNIGDMIAARELMNELRQSGETTGGPEPYTQKDRSKFLSKLDETVHAVIRLSGK